MIKSKLKILIFHPCLAPYRIDFYNSLAGRYDIKAGLFGSEEALAGLGFDVTYVNSQAEFDYRYYKGGGKTG